MHREEAIEAFRLRFGRDAEAVADAGGRVNLIGEHTDYHDGFVFPAAIDLRTAVAGARRDDGVIRVWSDNVGALVEASLADLSPRAVVDWQSYLLGPFWAMRESGRAVGGADVWLSGQVPFGGGLSSSASIEVALVGLAAALWGDGIAPMDAATVARAAENRFCRVPCGAMDQVASACGREGHALLLDCRTMERVHVPIPDGWAIVVADTGVKHSVAGAEYARRQQECAVGMAVVREAYPEVRAARDVTLAMLQSLVAAMPEVSFRRLRHVVTENERTLAARSALEAGDDVAMGRLMAASHGSLAGDYEVSCPELDALVDAAGAAPGLIGARLTGAGFGGNTVNLVHAGRVDDFCADLVDRYARLARGRTTARVVRAASGLRAARLQGA